MRMVGIVFEAALLLAIVHRLDKEQKANLAAAIRLAVDQQGQPGPTLPGAASQAA